MTKARCRFRRRSDGKVLDLDDVDRIVVERDMDGNVSAAILTRQGTAAPLERVIWHGVGDFAFGWDGRGAADLALSMLTACCGRELADEHHLAYKRLVVAKRHTNKWWEAVGTVREFVRERQWNGGG